MYKQISESLGYFDLPSKVVVYKKPSGEAILVDAGLDSRTARKVQREIEQLGLKPRVLVITHGHADHFGGANEFKKLYPELVVMASAEDRPVMEEPLYEPYYLYGAQPLPALLNKFLVGEAVTIDQVLTPGKTVTLLGEEWQIIDLHGHTPGQIGLVPPNERTILTADAFFAEEVVKKHRLPYHFDIEGALKTLQNLERWAMEGKYQLFLPGHGEPYESIQGVVVSNLQAIMETVELIQQAIAKKPLTREEVVAHVMTEYQIPETVTQYFLTFSTISAYLSYLVGQEVVVTEIREGKLLFISK